jgi:hypothetical protein
MRKHWLPTGIAFKLFLRDIKRVWTGPGAEPLQLLQVGVTVPLEDIHVPHLPIRKPAHQKAAKLTTVPFCRMIPMLSSRHPTRTQMMMTTVLMLRLLPEILAVSTNRCHFTFKKR